MKGYIGSVILYCACIHIKATTSAFSAWVPDGTIRYKFSYDRSTFESAMVNCNTDGSQVVTFSTPAQYKAFISLPNLDKNEQYWIGMRRNSGSASQRSSFYWLDGRNTSVSQEFWDMGNVVFSWQPGEDCTRMRWNDNQWEWWDNVCVVQYRYVCMQDIPTTTTTTTPTTTTTTPPPPTTTTTTTTTTMTPSPSSTTTRLPIVSIPTPPLTKTPATVTKTTSPLGEQPTEIPDPVTSGVGGVSDRSTGPKSPSDEQNMYIIIGGSLGGAALLVILVIGIVIFVVQLRRKRSDERAKHAVTNPTYENVDDGDVAGAPENHITAKGDGRVTSGNHYDSIDEDRQREVVYTDVETGTNGQRDQGATYEDVSYYNNVQVTAKPPKRTDTVGYSEVGMPSQFLAGSGVGAPNVG